MATLIHLDTHVLVWLYLARLDLFSTRAIELLEDRRLAVSPMALLELEYLHEVGRLRVGSQEVFQVLSTDLGVEVDDQRFERVLDAARHASWTRDPFDRILVGQASAAACELLTRDDTIHEHYPAATW